MGFLKNLQLLAAFLTLFACSLGVALGQDDEEVDKDRFIDRGEYVEDSKTGLLWQKDGSESGKHNYFQAADYAAQLKLGGIEGWRMPTSEELKDIFPATVAPFRNTKYTPLMCCKGADEFPSYWTAELDVRMTDYAFIYQWYNKGGANNCFASRNFGYVRCVHDPLKK